MLKLTFFCVLALLLKTSFAEPLRELSQERAVFHTNLGDLVIAFYPKAAPKTTAQILKLIAAGIYENAEIFRVEPGYVAQVENFDTIKPALSPERRAQIQKLPGEFNDLPHQLGSLSMARYDDPDSGESSFSFVLGDAPNLDHQYTLFGEVVKGLETLRAIESVSTDANHRPLTPLKISHAEVIADGHVDEAHLYFPKPIRNGPDPQAQLVFKWLAGIIFLFTVSMAVLKNFFPKIWI